MNNQTTTTTSTASRSSSWRPARPELAHLCVEHVEALAVLEDADHAGVEAGHLVVMVEAKSMPDIHVLRPPQVPMWDPAI